MSDLRLSAASAAGGMLSVTLRWTPPTSAASTTVRYASSPITPANWDSASLLGNSLPGSQDTLSADVPYSGGTLYFALRTQNAQDEWSDLSNNTFWPNFDVHLPLTRR